MVTPSDILAAFRQADDASATLWVKYSVDVVEKVDAPKVAQGAEPPTGSESPPQRSTKERELRYTVDVEVASKAGKWRSTTHFPLIADGEVKHDTSSVTVFNGRSVTTLEDNNRQNGLPHYSIGASNQSRTGFADLWDICGRRLLEKTLANVVRMDNPKPSFSITWDRSDPKNPCLLFQATFASGMRSKAWLEPSGTFECRQLERYKHDALLFSVRDVLYRKFEGIELPVQFVRDEYEFDGSVRKESRFHLEWARPRAADISDALFDLEIPPNATVWDADTQRLIRDTQQVQASLDQIASGRPGLRWLLVINVAFLCLVASAWAWRILRRRRSS
jgi:hypothetical protein